MVKACAFTDVRDDVVGDEYPSAEILGIDLSPIQPSWSASERKIHGG